MSEKQKCACCMKPVRVNTRDVLVDALEEIKSVAYPWSEDDPIAAWIFKKAKSALALARPKGSGSR